MNTNTNISLISDAMIYSSHFYQIINNVIHQDTSFATVWTYLLNKNQQISDKYTYFAFLQYFIQINIHKQIKTLHFKVTFTQMIPLQKKK